MKTNLGDVNLTEQRCVAGHSRNKRFKAVGTNTARKDGDNAKHPGVPAAADGREQLVMGKRKGKASEGKAGRSDTLCGGSDIGGTKVRRRHR